MAQSSPSAESHIHTADPAASKFQDRVSFDTFHNADATDFSLTLNVKHRGYKHTVRSRTFLVGINNDDYSDNALEWLLTQLADDGDEVICLRVVDKDSKISSDKSVEKKQYQDEAKMLMDAIQLKNKSNRAVSIVLEFAVGKLQHTFQKMVSSCHNSNLARTDWVLQISLYEPAMLIVGTRGRSLGGFQGLVSNRNSFSKYCLQYSPVPVVVVRPVDKREKKKLKRTNDPNRQNYLQILHDSGHDIHEANEKPGSANITAPDLLSKTPDTEAHLVAAALGLPAKFDPTIKPIDLASLGMPLRKVPSSSRSDITEDSQTDSRPTSPGMVMKSPNSAGLDSPVISDGEDSGEDDDEEDVEGEFEAVPGHVLLGNHPKQEKLHKMEQGEAAALAAGRKGSVGSMGSIESMTSANGAEVQPEPGSPLLGET